MHLQGENKRKDTDDIEDEDDVIYDPLIHQAVRNPKKERHMAKRITEEQFINKLRKLSYKLALSNDDLSDPYYRISDVIKQMEKLNIDIPKILNRILKAQSYIVLAEKELHISHEMMSKLYSPQRRR